MLDWIVGLHLLTAHAAPGYETLTPGGYAVSPDGYTVGAYRNSEGRGTIYGGYTFYGGRYSATLGLATGYARAPVVPLLATGIAFGDARISFLPGPSPAVHLSYERKFR